ncbi:MAG: hypothetical protein KAS63_05615 [Candidatus Heimdallarchaeota archaeon]|nr:hypothetical protein [Candidatus Heimdallarchaeota archaeon]MCK4954816.1 hypothetical protein [Candidatus Heimdallarchaeota archaeon]
MKCEHPSCNADEDILFYCRFCRGSFCENHRDPHTHKCQSFYPGSQPGAQTPGSSQGTQSQTPADILRQFAHQVSRSAQQQAQAQATPMTFKDEKSRRKFIEKRLISSGGLFSLGNEVLDILFGFSLIVLVFGLYQYFLREDQKWIGFLISGMLVGTAFVPHELAHKVVAIRRGQYARYILWVRGLLFTLLTLVIGIGLIVPGFVAIVPLSRQMDKKDLGLVAVAGPATNIVIGLVSLIIGLLTHYSVIPLSGLFANPNIFILVAQFNALIALFNCIPIWQLDGAKILRWNKIVYFVLVAINIAIFVPAFVLNPGFWGAT